MTLFDIRSRTGAAAILGLAVAFVPALANATTCSTVAACVLGTNTANGYGVEGTAKSNYAIFGTSSGNSGVYGATTVNATTAAGGKSGIAGYDSSTNKQAWNSGVFGYSAYGTGVHAKSASGTALYGESATGNGIVGYAQNSTGISGFGSVGVFAGTTAEDGIGLEATGGGYGITASLEETSNINPVAAIYAAGLQAAPAILADSEVIDTGSNTSDALDIINSGSGTSLGVFSDSATPLTLFGTGKTLVTAANKSKDVMSLDSSGNMILAGTLTQKGSAKIVSQRADGSSVLSYASRSADPTIEDVGEASVVNGTASVPLDPSFAGTINFARPYFVFLTPEGDNAGLYVSAKTARGFVVHEARGAHSTLRVQYRLVASPLDERVTTRLQSVNASLPDDNAKMASKFAALRARDTDARQRFAKFNKDHTTRVARG